MKGEIRNSCGFTENLTVRVAVKFGILRCYEKSIY